MSDFSQRLRQSMIKNNIKATELAQKSGIDKSSISHYLSGTYLPKQDKLYKSDFDLLIEETKKKIIIKVVQINYFS